MAKTMEEVSQSVSYFTVPPRAHPSTGPWKKTSFGAPRWRERSGGQISAQPAPLESPASGHHPHRLALHLLIIAATT